MLQELRQLRFQAYRKRVWFRLPHVDRSLVNLCLRMLETVKSSRLRCQLAKLIVRLQELLNPFTVSAKETLAKLVRVARSWGHKTARQWLRDRRFLQYLAIMEMNKTA